MSAAAIAALSAQLGLGMIAAVPRVAAQIRFEEAASSRGLGFTLENVPTPEKRMIETMAGGLAVFDYNDDGRLDLFLTNGADQTTMRKSASRFFNRLYRNDGGMRFSDVTAQANLAGQGYSMGAAAADFDNDGDTDLFVAGVFHNALYRNLGDGTFEDITAASGITGGEWSVSGGWFDFDGDSLLDLFVVNYADWTLEFDRYCGDRKRGLRVYCHPKYLAPIANRLYRNLGDGRFEDLTDEVGLSRFRGRGMSAAFADLDGDGSQDVFVTNDNLPNFLFLNQAGQAFIEDALLAGAALLDHGRPVASMGVDIADFDGDGHFDLSVTALSNETFPLFRGDGKGSFRDATARSGLARASRSYAGWGNAFADFDNDQWVDLFTANSHVNDLVEHFEPFPYLQPNTVFRNEGGTFGEPQEIGAARAYRGAVAADFDGDGLVDVAVTALGEQARIFRNASEGTGNWLGLHPVGTRSNRDALGAVVRVGRQVRWVKSAAGYASSVRRPVRFGLGVSDEPVTVRIDWPSGHTQVIEGLQPNAIVTVTEPQ